MSYSLTSSSSRCTTAHRALQLGLDQTVRSRFWLKRYAGAERLELRGYDSGQLNEERVGQSLQAAQLARCAAASRCFRMNGTAIAMDAFVWSISTGATHPSCSSIACVHPAFALADPVRVFIGPDAGSTRVL